ncbi:MAG: Ig-like domain-containing protein, partial [Clostridia bacterium]|nr:Ig-like domain-containing protein [Clostridia bacterium]
MKNVVKVEAGKGTVFAMLSNGETWGWGYNGNGQLGNGTRNTTSAKYIISEDFVDISTSYDSTIAIKEDGSTWTSGYNNYGQLGIGNTSRVVEFTETILSQNGVKAKYAEMSYVSAIILGQDGKTYVTGYNNYGQLSQGNSGSANNSNKFVPMLNSGNVEKNEEVEQKDEVLDGLFISKGNNNTNHITIVRKDGTIWAVGYNSYGQFGNASYDGEVYLKQMGEPEVLISARNEYIQIDETLDIDVISIDEFRVFIKEEPIQSDWEWKSSNEDVAEVDKNTGVVTGKSVGYTTITGYNSKLNVKARAVVNVYNKTEGAITTPQVVNGRNFSVVLREDGTVWTSGHNYYGQLGNGTRIDSNIPVQVKINEDEYLTDVKQISVGDEFAAALTKTGKVYVWGRGDYGQLGRGTQNKENSLYAIELKKVTETTITDEERNTNIEVEEEKLENIAQITASVNELFMLTNNGEIYGTGGGANNEYLEGNKKEHYVVTKVQRVSNAVKIDVGQGSIYAMISNGETWSWGRNQQGQLGNGTSCDEDYWFNQAGSYSIYFKYLIGNDIADVSSNNSWTVVIKEDGTVWGTGYNGYGQLGLEDRNNRNVLTKIVIDEEDIKAKYIASSNNSTYVLGKNGKIYVSGNNYNGQLSQGTQGNGVNLSGFKEMLNSAENEVEDGLFVSKGNINTAHTTIVRKDGTIWAVGYNEHGQFGNAKNLDEQYLTQMGETEVLANARNEYIKVDEI